MERKNLLFIKNECSLSNKLSAMVGENYKIICVNDVKIPEELKNYEVPFIIVKNIIKPIECENAIAYLENLKFYNQQTNNITNKIVQMKMIVNELDLKGTNSEFNKITDEYTFIEDGKNIEKIHRGLENIDDSNKIDIVTDFNNESRLYEKDTAQELKDMVFNRNRQLQLQLQSRRKR
jgi:hypothetical protein